MKIIKNIGKNPIKFGNKGKTVVLHHDETIEVSDDVVQELNSMKSIIVEKSKSTKTKQLVKEEE